MAYGPPWLRVLYDHAPYYLKVAAATWYGVRERRERYGSYYYDSLEFLKKSQYWDNLRLLEYQQEQTARFVTESLRTTPYYSGNKAYDVSLQLAELPILKKQDVRANQRLLYSDKLSSMRYRFSRTSGTTGTPLRFPLTTECFQREYAFRALHYLWGNIDLTGRKPIVICAGHPVAFHSRESPPFWVHDRANNWLLMSSYHLTQANLGSYIRELERFQPMMIGGYPSSVFLLAAGFQKYGQRPLSLRAIFTSSETLLMHQRQIIETAFDAKVFNWYGTSEMTANIVECEMRELHLKLEHSMVEILNDSDQPSKPDETGRLVCTASGNRAFPLIRYDVGDIVTLAAHQNSKCGRGGTLIKEVTGRREDYVVTPDGRLVGRLDHLFKDIGNVIEAQIVQEKIEEVRIRVVKAAPYSISDEQHLLKEARIRLGDSIRISLEYVDGIPRGRNGKFKFIDSSLNQQRILAELI